MAKFKFGENIEISDDGRRWLLRIFVRYSGLNVICRNPWFGLERMNAGRLEYDRRRNINYGPIARRVSNGGLKRLA